MSLLETLLKLAELGLDISEGIAKAARAKTDEEEQAALDQLDATNERGRGLVSSLRQRLAAGDNKLDAEADSKWPGGNP